MPQTRTRNFVGSAYIENGSAWSRSSATMGAFTPNANVSPVIEFNPGPGAISTTASQQPRFTVNSLPAGTYRVIIGAILSTAGGNANLAIWDGSTFSGYCGNDTQSNKLQTLVGYFTYSVAGNRSFEVYGKNDSASSTAIYALGTGTNNEGWKLNFSIEKVA